MVTIAFVIGVSAIVRPIKTSREIVLRDAVFLAIVTLVAATLLLDGNLTQYEGVALIALFIPYILNLAISQRTGPAEEIEERVDDMTIGLAFTGWIFGRKVEVRAGLSWLIFGILWSVMRAQFLVRGEGIGASVVTTLLTLGMIGIVSPANHSVELLVPVVGAMVFTSFLLLALMLGGWRITSRAGAVLTPSYFAMLAFNVLWMGGGLP